MTAHPIYGVKKIYRSVRAALFGIRKAYAEDESFRLEINWGLPIYVLVAFFLWPFALVEWIFFVGSYLAILRAELVNTGIEFSLNHLHPDRHERIGAAKDASAGAVLLEFVFAAFVILLLFLRRHFDLPLF